MRLGPTRGVGPHTHIGGAENPSFPDNVCFSQKGNTSWWSSRIDEACHSGWMNIAPSRLRPGEDILLPKTQCVPMERGSSVPPSGRTQSRGESDASTRSARTSSRSGTSFSPRHCGMNDAVTSARVSDISTSSTASAFVGMPPIVPTGPGTVPLGQCASVFAHPQTGVTPVSSATAHSFVPGQTLTDSNGATNPMINFHSPADHTLMQIDTLHNHQMSIAPDTADYNHHHEYVAMAEMVEAKKSQITAILNEITTLTREQRVRQEELHSERKMLARMEAEIRAQGAEEARTQFQAEVAESRHQVGEELRVLTSELQQERRDSEAKKLGMDAMKNLYEKKCDSKDQEIRALREALADREIQKAKIRELTDELRMEREGRIMSETDATTLPLLPVTFAPAPGMVAGSSARRRLSYSADYNEPIFQSQEGPVELALPLESEAFQTRGTDATFPTAPPSTGVQTSGIGALSSDARRRLSYSRAAATVGTQTPETPAVDPSLGGMAQKLFDSQLEASSVNNTILATPVTAEVSFPVMELSFAMASVDAPWGEVTTAHVAFPDELTPPALETAVSSSCCSTVVATQPVQANTDIEQTPQIESHDLNLLCLAHQTVETTIGSVPPKAIGARTPPVAKATAKPLPRTSANESVSCRRASSERGRAPRAVDRSARSPMRFSMSATPPKVLKESPPRGCVAEKVNLFEQRCTTPSGQTGSLNTPRQVGTGAVPDTLRRGPRGAPVPTPNGASAVASASRLCRAEERAHPRGSERAHERTSTPRAASLCEGCTTRGNGDSTEVDLQQSA